MSVRLSRGTGADPSCRIVDAVAAHFDVDPTELDEPLYESVDLEAVDALFASAREAGQSVTLAFQYRGREVFVGTDGRVSVSDNRTD